MAKVGDCLVNKGSAEKPDMQKVACAANTYQVLKRIDGTADKNKWFGATGSSLVALSLDEGRTWPHVRKVEAPVGGYMSLAQHPDGTIYLIGSRLQFAACNEAWLKEGKPIEAVKGR